MSLLYLVRHAAAEDARAGMPDAQRALTDEGTRKFRRAAAGIVRLLQETPPGLILSSPLLRARQTAELLHEAFDKEKIKTQVQLSEALVDAEGLGKLLKEVRGKPAMAVGHEPILSMWIGKLCFGEPGDVEMKKGALAALELKTGTHAQLLYLLQPAILREL